VNACVEGQVDEGDILKCGVVREWTEIDRRRAHLAAVVVEPRLPANEILDILDDEVSDVIMLGVVAGKPGR